MKARSALLAPALDGGEPAPAPPSPWRPIPKGPLPSDPPRSAPTPAAPPPAASWACAIRTTSRARRDAPRSRSASHAFPSATSHQAADLTSDFGAVEAAAWERNRVASLFEAAGGADLSAEALAPVLDALARQDWRAAAELLRPFAEANEA